MGLKEEKGLKLTIKAMMVTLGLLLFLTAPLKSFADAAPGDVIITLGQDLTSSQKQQVLNEKWRRNERSKSLGRIRAYCYKWILANKTS